MTDKVRVTPLAHRAKWAQQKTVHDESIHDLIDGSSLGAGLRNIHENGIDAEIADLERQTRPRYRR